MLHYPLWMIPFLNRSFVRRIRAFYVHPTGDILPSTVTTYHIRGGASYAFLPQKPEKMNSLARFYLFHEIGHGAVINSFNRWFDWHASVHFCLLFVFVAFHREAGILELLIAFAIVAMWAHYLDLQHLQQQRNRDERPEELVADAFALVHLDERSDFRTTISRIARNFRKRSKESPFWRYRARLLVQRAQILSRRKKEFKLESEKGLRMMGFEHITPPVPVWLGAVIISGMVWLGATLSIKDWEELLALSLVWVVVPVLDHSYRMLRKMPLPFTAQARLEALEFLRAHAPPDLPTEGCDLRLMSVNTAYDLVNEGRNLVIVAFVGTNLHIRIFDANGKRVVDKAENELMSGGTLTTLKKQLNTLPDESCLSQEQKQKIIRDVTSIAGHTPKTVSDLF